MTDDTLQSVQTNLMPCRLCGIIKVPAVWIGKWYPQTCGNCREILAEAEKQAQQEREAHEAECLAKQREAEIQSRLFQTIPPVFAGASIDRLPGGLQEQIAGLGNQGLYLFGVVGCGKSYTGAAMARHDIEAGRWPVMIINWERFLSSLRSSFGGQAGASDRQIQEVMRAEVLYIDDLAIGGSESEYSTKTLYAIIDDRLENSRITHYAANRSPDDIGKTFDARIASRIKGSCRVVQYTGKDRRVSK